MSLTFTLINKNSVLAIYFFVAVHLSDGGYELDLMDFETYQTISNVNSLNNKFYFDEDDKKIVILEGSYKIHEQVSKMCVWSKV